MSALHRLAHPLIGYDSVEALPPKARKRRQESAERVSTNFSPLSQELSSVGSIPRSLSSVVCAERRKSRTMHACPNGFPTTVFNSSSKKHWSKRMLCWGVVAFSLGQETACITSSAQIKANYLLTSLKHTSSQNAGNMVVPPKTGTSF